MTLYKTEVVQWIRTRGIHLWNDVQYIHTYIHTQNTYIHTYIHTQNTYIDHGDAVWQVWGSPQLLHIIYKVCSFCFICCSLFVLVLCWAKMENTTSWMEGKYGIDLSFSSLSCQSSIHAHAISVSDEIQHLKLNSKLIEITHVFLPPRSKHTDVVHCLDYLLAHLLTWCSLSGSVMVA